MTAGNPFHDTSNPSMQTSRRLSLVHGLDREELVQPILLGQGSRVIFLPWHQLSRRAVWQDDHRCRRHQSPRNSGIGLAGLHSCRTLCCADCKSRLDSGQFRRVYASLFPSRDLRGADLKWSSAKEEHTSLGDTLEFSRFLRHPFIDLRQRA